MADKAYSQIFKLDKKKRWLSFYPLQKTYKVKWETDRQQYKKRNVVERFF